MAQPPAQAMTADEIVPPVPAIRLFASAARFEKQASGALNRDDSALIPIPASEVDWYQGEAKWRRHALPSI